MLDEEDCTAVHGIFNTDLELYISFRQVQEGSRCHSGSRKSLRCSCNGAHTHHSPEHTRSCLHMCSVDYVTMMSLNTH